MSKVCEPICTLETAAVGLISKKKITSSTFSLRPRPPIDHRLKLPFIIRLIVCENVVEKIHWHYFRPRPYI